MQKKLSLFAPRFFHWALRGERRQLGKVAKSERKAKGQKMGQRVASFFGEVY